MCYLICRFESYVCLNWNTHRGQGAIKCPWGGVVSRKRRQNASGMREEREMEQEGLNGMRMGGQGTGVWSGITYTKGPIAEDATYLGHRTREIKLESLGNFIPAG